MIAVIQKVVPDVGGEKHPHDYRPQRRDKFDVVDSLIPPHIKADRAEHQVEHDHKTDGYKRRQNDLFSTDIVIGKGKKIRL